MPDLNNTVNPLFWDVPIVNPNGTPTRDFMRKWEQQAATNGSIPDLTTAKAVSAILDLVGSTIGDLLVRGTFTWGALPPNTAGYVLTDNGPGATPTWQKPAAPASALDDGTTFYLAMQDVTGQLVLDGSGDPIFAPEVLPANAIPIDGTTIGAVAGLLSVIGLPAVSFFQAQLTTNVVVTNNAYTTILFDTVTGTIAGQYNAATGIFTPTKAGKYLVFTSNQVQAATGGDWAIQCNAIITKNGVIGTGTTVGAGVMGSIIDGSATQSGTAFAFCLVAMNGSTDNLRVNGYASVNAGVANFVGANNTVFFGAVYLGP